MTISAENKSKRRKNVSSQHKLNDGVSGNRSLSLSMASASSERDWRDYSIDSYDALTGARSSSSSSGSRNMRGKYKCSRCGELKTNHICAIVLESEQIMTVSVGIQAQPFHNMTTTSTLLAPKSTSSSSSSSNTRCRSTSSYSNSNSSAVPEHFFNPHDNKGERWIAVSSKPFVSGSVVPVAP